MKQSRLARLVAIGALALACRSPAGLPPETAGDDAGRISIAVVPFGVAPGSSPPPIDVAEVIRADLASSSRFAPMAAADMPSRPTEIADIRFEDWQRVKADYLVVGRVATVHDGGHEVEFRLIDTRAQTALVEFLVPSAPDQLERTALAIAELIDQRLMREAGATHPTTAACLREQQYRSRSRSGSTSTMKNLQSPHGTHGASSGVGVGSGCFRVAYRVSSRGASSPRAL